MSQFWIKAIAAITMVIDHIGAIFFPDVALLRIIGRLSFPMFAWLLGQGEQHTRNFGRYLLRLLIVGVISQLLFAPLFEDARLNILFTLAIGLLAQRLGKLFPEEKYVIWVIGMAIGALIPIDYGAYGIAVILVLANFRPQLTWWALWLVMHLIYFLIEPAYASLQVFAIAAPLLLHATNGRRGPKARWFYGFYPGHLLILLLIKWGL
jgi:hypothetical protein